MILACFFVSPYCSDISEYRIKKRKEKKGRWKEGKSWPLEKRDDDLLDISSACLVNFHFFFAACLSLLYSPASILCLFVSFLFRFCLFFFFFYLRLFFVFCYSTLLFPLWIWIASTFDSQIFERRRLNLVWFCRLRSFGLILVVYIRSMALQPFWFDSNLMMSRFETALLYCRSNGRSFVPAHQMNWWWWWWRWRCLMFDACRLEPGTAPKNVQVRPLSSTTMLIQWEEPDTPNGQVIVSDRPSVLTS